MIIRIITLALPLVVAGAVVAAAPTSAKKTPPGPEPPPAATPPAERLIAVGDHVRYQVLEDRDAPVELVVSNTGMIDLPYYGPLPAAGRSLADLSAAVKAVLEADLYLRATVRIQVLAYSATAANHGRVNLSGQVRHLGPFEIDLSEHPTLGQTILAAGGLADFADPRNVRIIRKVDGATRTITVNLREVLTEGRIDKDVELKDGDFIIVDERIINW